MGEAKRRGSQKQRHEQALARRTEEEKHKQEVEKTEYMKRQEERAALHEQRIREFGEEKAEELLQADIEKQKQARRRAQSNVAAVAIAMGIMTGSIMPSRSRQEESPFKDL